MFARVSTIQAGTDRIDEGIGTIRNEIIPAVRQLSGFQGVISLVDRGSGKGITLTLWETEEDLRASEQQADQLRSQAAQSLGATQPAQVDRYEVALYEVEAGVTVR